MIGVEVACSCLVKCMNMFGKELLNFSKIYQKFQRKVYEKNEYDGLNIQHY